MQIVDCETQEFPTNITPRPQLIAVLTRDELTGLYAVYAAIVQTPLAGEHPQVFDWIAHHGAKQSFQHSRQFFRGVTEAEYRH